MTARAWKLKSNVGNPVANETGGRYLLELVPGQFKRGTYLPFQ